ncbi:A24 family peptidase [Pseudomonas sp. FP597]|uniref:prepilin peptidase n=1 Tax=Pseudomonas sp. FP597 TaxID=2954096 RepID=UPI00273753E0|nr:A24 family peptidase [Pseudomonas sp. FP597]WLI07561.1 A24 family peptidase [Pseudomonas sp. FP597]
MIKDIQVYDSRTIGLSVVGLLAGVPISALVVGIPAYLETQWRLDADQMLVQDSATERLPNSFLLFRARPITLRTCITMLAMGLLSTWAALHYEDGPVTFAALVLASGLLTLSLIDFDHQLLPDLLMLPLLWLGLILNSFELFTTLSHAVWGAVGGYLLLWFIRGLFKMISGSEGMGQGDLKLMAMLGAWGGLQILPVVLMLSTLAVTLVVCAGIASSKIDRTTPIPFGPFLAGAGWLALLYTPDWPPI